MKTDSTRRLARLAPILLASLLVGTLAAPVAAAPPPTVIFTFPGCAPTLQGCIANAPEGALIQIATNGPIDEDLNIQRSLQLRAAPDFHPVFTPFSNIFAMAPVGMPRHLLIQGLTWEPAGSSGVLQVVHGTEGRFDVEILDNRFLGITGSTSGSLVTVSTAGTPRPAALGPIALSLAGNEFDVPSGTETNPVALSFTSALAGTVRVAGNTVRTADQRQQSAIDLYHTEGELAVEVERNVIASANPEQSGVNVYQTGDGSGRIAARVFDNLITGFDGGMRFGVSFYASAGTIDLTVLHNTVVSASLRAVQVGGREDLGGHASGIIANNVLVFSERSDVGIHQFLDTVRERRNLVTHIGGPDDAPEAPSPDDIVVTDPQFVGPDDYRLEPTSAGINTASIELLPEDIMSDLDRNPRVAGPAPDMGAYELPCEPDSTEPHCVKQPSCEETGCTTDDPCYPARCINDQCVVIEPVGLEHARCACDRPAPSSCPSTPLPTDVRRRVEHACTFLERAGKTTSESRYPRLLTSAQGAFDRAIRGVHRRAILGQISSTCATDFAADFTDARERIAQLIE